MTSPLASNRLPFCVYTSASLVLLMGEKLVQRWREVSWFKPESAAKPICFLKRLNVTSYNCSQVQISAFICFFRFDFPVISVSEIRPSPKVRISALRCLCLSSAHSCELVNGCSQYLSVFKRAAPFIHPSLKMSLCTSLLPSSITLLVS